MRKILTIVAVLALAVALVAPANAAWRIGGTGPFITFPFYVEGTYDGVSLKTYLVVNNTNVAAPVSIVSAIHFPDSSPAANYIGAANVTGLANLRAANFASEMVLIDAQLTQSQSMIIVPGTSDPVLPYDLPYPDSRFTLGWVETWVYNTGVAAPRPVLATGAIRGEAITVDLANRTAFNYKAVASVSDSVANLFVAGDESGTATTNAILTSVTGAFTGNNSPDVIFNSSWNANFQVPERYHNLADRYNVDLWVKSLTNTNNNTNIIITNPNHRRLGASICRDNTTVDVDTYNSQENSSHSNYQVGEMRLISFALDIPGAALAPDTWYGRATLTEVDSVNAWSAGDAGGCTAFLANVRKAGPNNITNEGFLATVFTSWQTSAGTRTWWGTNAFNNCGDAFTLRDIATLMPTHFTGGAAARRLCE